MFAGFQCRIAAEEKLRYLAEHDDLTGLHNRRSLVAHLSDRFAAGRRGPVAVLYLDLDRLKSINDCLRPHRRRFLPPMAGDEMEALLSARRLPTTFFEHDKACDVARELATQR
jgi:GGDEF domain-containing protein